MKGALHPTSASLSASVWRGGRPFDPARPSYLVPSHLLPHIRGAGKWPQGDTPTNPCFSMQWHGMRSSEPPFPVCSREARSAAWARQAVIGVHRLHSWAAACPALALPNPTPATRTHPVLGCVLRVRTGAAWVRPPREPAAPQGNGVPGPLRSPMVGSSRSGDMAARINTWLGGGAGRGGASPECGWLGPWGPAGVGGGRGLARGYNARRAAAQAQ